MNKNIMKSLGKRGKEWENNFERKICPICKVMIESNSGFKDSLSLREYKISGLCQTCQDKIFGI